MVELVGRDLERYLRTKNCKTEWGHWREVVKFWKMKNRVILDFFRDGNNARDQELPINEYRQTLLLEQVIRLMICQQNEGQWVRDDHVKKFKTEHDLHNVVFVRE
eukprot:UN14918